MIPDWTPGDELAADKPPETSHVMLVPLPWRRDGGTPCVIRSISPGARHAVRTLELQTLGESRHAVGHLGMGGEIGTET